MNIKNFNNNPLSTLKMLTGIVVLGGALYGFTLSPAYSQPTPPVPPVGEAGDDLRPIEGDVKVGPDGRLLDGPERGPKDGPKRGPKDGPKDGPKRGPKDGQKNGPKRGPKDGPKQGPKHGPKDGPKDGPHGPREGKPGPHGPEGPDGPGPDGPRGGPGHEGTHPGGPDGPRGPHEKRGPEATMERVYRGAGELDRYGMLEGDVLNLTGQAHDYYNRAGVALKAGDKSQAEKFAFTSQRLTQAALHLVRAEKGSLPQIKVAGWEAPPQTEAPAPPVEDQDKQPRIAEDLSRRLQDVSAAPVNASWVETARRLAAQAQNEMEAKNIDAGRERAMAAMQLLEAADSHTPPQPV